MALCTRWSRKILEMFRRSNPLLINGIFMNRLLGEVFLTKGYSLFCANATMIFSLNQSVFLKNATSASSKIDFNWTAGTEERACSSSCLPPLHAMISRSLRVRCTLALFLKFLFLLLPWDLCFLLVLGRIEKKKH